MPNTSFETRARILAVAARRLSGRSAQFVNLREIATGADVTPSTIIQHFGSKDELVMEVRMNEVAAGIARDLSSVSHLPDGLEKAIAFVEHRIRSQCTTPWVIKDLLQGASQWTEAQQARFETLTAPAVQVFKDALRAQFGLTPRTRESELNKAGCHAKAVFESVMREAIARSWQPERAMDEFRRQMSIVVDALEQRLSSLLSAA